MAVRGPAIRPQGQGRSGKTTSGSHFRFRFGSSGPRLPDFARRWPAHRHQRLGDLTAVRSEGVGDGGLAMHPAFIGPPSPITRSVSSNNRNSYTRATNSLNTVSAVKTSGGARQQQYRWAWPVVWRAREREPITGVLGRIPQRGSRGQSPR